MKRIFSLCLLLVLALGNMSLVSCGQDNPDEPKGGFKVSGVSIPASVEVATGDEVRLKVYGQGPEKEDYVILADESGKEHRFPLSFCSATEFGFVIPEGLYTGTYEIHIERNGERVRLGKLNLIVILKADFDLAEGTTVYGLVTCDGKPVEGVVVSDGYELDQTDAKGSYQLPSEKRHGYVFMSIPSGYTVKTDKSLPLFHQYLSKPAGEQERVDFVLVEDPGQDNHTIIVMGDIHLAKRTDDINQFQHFVTDLNKYMASNSSKKFYGLTLGDMSWDQYWIPNGYDLTNYLKDIAGLNGLTVFNTIGNHDHEQDAAGDFNTVAIYKKIIGPTYYSFNIGKVHYVVLDDIECTNSGAGDRSYNTKIVDEQIEWLRKDLQFVSSETPVVLAMHSPVYNESGVNRLANSGKVIEVLSGRKVHIMTGHTHIMYNVDNLGESDTGHYEHNSGAVCATWWWSGYEVPGIHISTDGTPGGYRVFDVEGTEFEWVYKGTGKDESYQFRTYDRNEIHMTIDTYVPEANADNAEKFIKTAKDYTSVSSANEVLINIWDYDPDWTVEVQENGQPLEVTKVTMCDPLHLAVYSARRLNKNKAATFLTGATSHMFKVTASSATSTLNIKVTDRFGNIYTEDMARPKAFDFDNYK